MRGTHYELDCFRRVCSPLPYGVFSYFEVLPDSATAVSKDMPENFLYPRNNFDSLLRIMMNGTTRLQVDLSYANILLLAVPIGAISDGGRHCTVSTGANNVTMSRHVQGS